MPPLCDRLAPMKRKGSIDEPPNRCLQTRVLRPPFVNVDMLSQEEVEQHLGELNTRLFSWIPSATSIDDRRSFLSIQGAVAGDKAPYRYLEIGSDLGGSIQPYLLDSRCAGIISIDKRVLTQPDERGKTYRYRHNSTQKMLDNLGNVSRAQVGKITTFDSDVGTLNPSAMPFRPDVCFIDGEHTDRAVVRDFAWCLSVVTTPGVIYFHDSNVVFRGLSSIVRCLTDSGVTFHAYNLPTSVFVIELGGADIHKDGHIQNLLVDNYRGYLAGMHSMAHFRTFSNLPLLRHTRIAVEWVQWLASHLTANVNQRLLRKWLK